MRTLKPKHPNWYIYSHHWGGGWFAYNDKTKEKLELESKDFCFAVSKFEELTGHRWYS